MVSFCIRLQGCSGVKTSSLILIVCSLSALVTPLTAAGSTSLTTLETRRLRGDQIEVFKILNGYENIDINMFFSLKKDSRTRGYEVTLVKDQCRLDIRKYSFIQRTINEWNEHCWTLDKPMASLSTLHLGLWLGWQILLNLSLCLL